MNKILKLSKIAAIRSGMVVSKTSNKNEDKLTNTFVRLLSTSDFDEEGNINKHLLPNAIYKPVFEKNYLQTGEILFNAKGRRFFALPFKGEYQHCIASTTFLVLSVKSNDVLPEYLLWFLNHPFTLNIFNVKMHTQTLPSVSKKELADLDITIPSLKTQKNIIALHNLNIKKNKLTHQLSQLENQYLDTLTYKKIKNEQ